MLRALPYSSDEREGPGRQSCGYSDVQDRDSAYLTVPYSGTWNVLIDSHSQSLEHSISYVPA